MQVSPAAGDGLECCGLGLSPRGTRNLRQGVARIKEGFRRGSGLASVRALVLHNPEPVNVCQQHNVHTAVM
jgi:hypothetical protein